MTIRKAAMLAVVAAMTAMSAVAALSPNYADWAKGPVQFLMTNGEKNAWKNVTTDEQAQAFIDLFWARRDPTPDTPVNEFRNEFDTRVKFADEHFAVGRNRGALSDRGRILILFGVPSAPIKTSTERQQTDTPTPEEREVAGERQNVIHQTWHYEGDAIQPLFGTKSVDIVFIDSHGLGDFRLDRQRFDLNGAALRVVTAAIHNPDLKEAPKYAAQTPAPQPSAPAAAPAVKAPSYATSFKNASYQTAIEEFRKATNNPYAGKLFVQWGEFVTPKGEYFVPVELYVPKSAALASTTDLTFFGLVEGSDGKPLAVFEEPATLTMSKDDYFFDKSLVLPAGTHKAYFGLAQGGKPVSIIQTEMKLAGSLDKSAPGISSLILSNNIYPLPKAQMPTDPYAFGGIKVVPKADRTFTVKDELWYFFELRNPGLDSAQKPNLQVAVELDGTLKDGKPVKMRNPAQVTDAQPLAGVPGHWAVGQALNLATFKPGDYTLKVKATDTITKQSYELTESFKIVG